jgi:hypothetical protein
MVSVPFIVIIHWQNKHMHMFMNDVKCISFIMETKISNKIIFSHFVNCKEFIKKRKIFDYKHIKKTDYH